MANMNNIPPFIDKLMWRLLTVEFGLRLSPVEILPESHLMRERFTFAGKEKSIWYEFFIYLSKCKWFPLGHSSVGQYKFA